jgi:2-dehydropantoate 2-reductase
LEIKTVSLVGLGALGTLFGNLLSHAIPPEDLHVIADRDRIDRYQRDGVYANGEPCRFQYVAPEAPCPPADLLLIAVKYHDLNDAIAAARGHVGPNTVILSLLNGISSEEIIGRAFGDDKVLLCVAQGMDAVKVGNRLTYHNTGLMSFGSREPGVVTDTVRRVARFFEKTGVPHEVVPDMPRRQWSKFMLNVGAIRLPPCTGAITPGYSGPAPTGRR